ncbi:hypothetical protein HYV79_02665 [Candidatus Woesearchaeota archaeon]|nr:hypothetical protein [Candidatus Woesearchaeota archaeon]
MLYKITALIFVIICTILPFTIRIFNGNTAWIGVEPYKYAIENQYTFFHNILQTSLNLFGENITGVLLPWILTVFGIILVVFTARNYNLPVKTGLLFISLPLYPAVLSLSSQFSPLTWSFFLISAALYALSKNNLWLAIIIFLLLSDFSILHISIILLFCSIIDKEFFKKVIPWGIVIALVRLLMPLNTLQLLKTSPLSAFFSDVGGVFGVSFFLLIAVLIGLIKLWKFKKKFYSLYAIAIIIVMLSFHYLQLVPYTIIIFSVISAFSFQYVLELKWQLVELRKLFLMIFFLSLFFSMITHAYHLSELLPNEDQKSAFKSLKKITSPVFFSGRQNAPLIAFWSEKNTSLYNSETNEEFDMLLQTYSIENAINIIKKHNITHIVITPDMWQGSVWNNKEEGLNLLLLNTETFQLVENSTNVYVWKFIGK